MSDYGICAQCKKGGHVYGPEPLCLDCTREMMDRLHHDQVYEDTRRSEEAADRPLYYDADGYLID